MAEVTKITSPLIPKENLGSKNRPTTEQTFELNSPNRVNKAAQEPQVREHDAGNATRDNLNAAVMRQMFRDSNDLMYNVQKMFTLLQLGISTSDIMQDAEIKQILNQIFASPDQLMEALLQQDEAAVLFKGQAFDILRDVLDRFQDMPKIPDSMAQVLKAYEQNVNLENSMKSILHHCINILDYMFSQDREQFAGYLEGLAQMLLPNEFAEEGAPVQAGIEPKEAAAVLKNNLLPLLGEIVVKYHQNERIRDIVMVVVHNIVRVDKGTPEALENAVNELVSDLKKLANLPEEFGKNLLEALEQNGQEAKAAQNQVMDKLAAAISETLHSGASSPTALRQAENLLLSLLQNQSSMMNVLHFMLPLQTPDDRIFAELYVDPDSDEGKGKGGRDKSPTRKIFLSADSESHGTFELCFWETGGKVDFSIWCPGILVKPLHSMRRTIGDLMQVHGYSMSGFKVEEFVRPQTVAQVFPKLLNRRVGIDVRV